MEQKRRTIWFVYVLLLQYQIDVLYWRPRVSTKTIARSIGLKKSRDMQVTRYSNYRDTKGAVYYCLRITFYYH